MNPSPMRTLSLAALTVLDLSPPQMVETAAAVGCTHVGLRLVPATEHEPRWPTVGDTALIRETRARLADTGVRVLDVEILRLRPDTGVDAFVPVLDTAVALGARYVLVAGNDADEARCTQHLAQLAELCAARGLMPCIEPMPFTEVRHFAQALRMVDGTGSANVGVLIDPIHFDRAGDRPEMLHGADAARLPYLQFCDAPKERPVALAELLRQARSAREVPGEGGLALADLLRAAPQGVPLSLEVPLQESGPAVQRARRVVEGTRRWLKGEGL